VTSKPAIAASDPIATAKPTAQPTSKPTPTVQPVAKGNVTVLPVLTNAGMVNLTLQTDLGTVKVSNAIITTNQSQTANTTIITLNVTQESPAVGFANLTIPKSVLPPKATPQLYVDRQTWQNQTYSQDQDNYYVGYTPQAGTHEVTIEFTQKQAANLTHSIVEIMLIGMFVLIFMGVGVFAYGLRRKLSIAK
jgi:hypothetical protein